MRKKFQPKSFVLQWHITERCNWRCKHCYQEKYDTTEMEFGEMERVISQFVDLVKSWGIPKNKARIHITGGEPFLQKDFFRLLKKLGEHSDHFLFGIMSNGSLLTKDNARELKEMGTYAFQVSLEGTKKTNDEIRGRGSFQKILAAIRILDATGINIGVSLTLTKRNFLEIHGLADILAPLGVRNLRVRRIAPFGLKADQMKMTVLEPKELRYVYREIEDINREMQKKNFKLQVSGGCENAVFNDEISSLDLMSHGVCGVIEGRTLTLMPNGDVLVCRRFPIKIGNILEKTLEEIYYSPIYENLRGQNADAPFECYSCPNMKSCLGGAKCVSYALTGKIAPDVQCWKLFRSLEEAVSHVKSPKLSSKMKLFFGHLRNGRKRQ